MKAKAFESSAFDKFAPESPLDVSKIIADGMAKLEAQIRREHGTDALILWNTLDLKTSHEQSYDDLLTLGGDADRVATYRDDSIHFTVTVAVPKEKP